MTRAVASLISGKPVAGSPGGTLIVTNPAHLDQVVAEASLGDAGTFVDACRAARAAQPGWAAVPAPVRGRAVQQLGRLVEDNAEALAQLITREIGKPIAESRGEVREVVDTCSFFLGEGRRLYGQTVPSEMPDKHLFTFRVPVGVAAIVTAGNFPVAVPSWYLVPALLCGNAVVWKPAEYTPAIAEAFAQLFLHAGFAEGVFNMVLAGGPETFEGLQRALDEKLVDKVGFTGSTEVGRRIGELCGRHLQSPCLELGGKNPMVVMPDADLDLAEIKSLLQRAAKSIHQQPDRLKCAMNNFVITIACYVKPLHKLAVDTADGIGQVAVDLVGACKIPFAPDQITKFAARSAIGKKRKSPKC